ncbi:MAG: acetyl-CoA carboxylase biotin carboxyl carrier protein subunit [Lentimicrobiaceae bacterium]|nr:acetyl-CoA carboxylase biotin carboxyl carrier protein subunit [Lentimicrobiaceae bacterium]MCB9023912.1 acetyl-CoA carboxylase biotin carboxyl carrier protein subunit [Lentimicrobiaceae bacterium]MCO5266466.1 acetyl-CoA carboxylase biotin carboxyl carrier protein subunit [Lentimicrobium sp.]
MEENNEAPALKSIIIDNVKYKTRLTKKFMARKVYEPIDLKKVYSFIPGTILKVHIKEGAKVKQGTKLLELEAMKMANNIVAPIDGVVAKINVKSGDLVPKNFLLVEME